MKANFAFVFLHIFNLIKLFLFFNKIFEENEISSRCISEIKRPSA